MKHPYCLKIGNWSNKQHDIQPPSLTVEKVTQVITIIIKTSNMAKSQLSTAKFKIQGNYTNFHEFVTRSAHFSSFDIGWRLFGLSTKFSFYGLSSFLNMLFDNQNIFFFVKVFIFWEIATKILWSFVHEFKLNQLIIDRALMMVYLTSHILFIWI